MLDHTNGRLEIGVVSRIPPELAVVGITTDVAAARHAEVIDVLDAAGHPHGPEQIAVRRMITFVESPSEQREAVHRAKRALLDVLTASAGPLPPWASLLDRPDESIAALSDEEFVSGTPQQVAEQLIEQCQIIGAGHLLVAFSERDHDRLKHSHELFSAEVAPLLSEAQVA